MQNMAQATMLTYKLKGKWFGEYGTASCPSHDDRRPSLSISAGKDGKVLLHCHAGCDQAQVIDVLRSRGLWEPSDPKSGRERAYKQQPSADLAAKQRDAKRTEVALQIWRASAPAPGTPVETYLNSRNLHLALPPVLRFHSALRHPSGGSWPALVAVVTRGTDNIPLAIHRTYIAPDGSEKAPVDPQKMMLGPCRGGAVRLGRPGEVLMVGEGIETCLAAMQETGTPTWAALSTSGLRTLNLPSDVRDVIVLADGDRPGEAAARDCASRWQGEGRRVRIARPPQGMDFNDLIMGGVLQIEEDQACQS